MTRPTIIEYTTPTVETSVAVAMPSITAERIKKGKASAGSAMKKLRMISRTDARRTPAVFSQSERIRQTTTTTSALNRAVAPSPRRARHHAPQEVNKTTGKPRHFDQNTKENE